MSDQAKGEETSTSNNLLSECQKAYAASKTFFDQSVASRARDAYDRFYSRHVAKSKYHTEAFAKRSKLFRPKTRVAVRNIEAQASISAFSTKDFVNCIPLDKRNKKHQLAAELQQHLLNARLGGGTYTKTSIPWYSIYIGAIQEAVVQGVIVSKQSWDYSDYDEQTSVIRQDVETGQQVEDVTSRLVVELDRPSVRLLPIERFKIDPSASWDDPISTAAWLIDEIPMYVMDVKKRMEIDGPTGWIKMDEDAIRGKKDHETAGVTQAREPHQQDRHDLNDGLGDYEIVWVYEHLRRTADGDVLVYTLSDEVLLSEPIPMELIYPQGRPYVMGRVQIEAHRLMSSGVPEVTADLADEINSIANLRIDGVTLSMMGRYFYKRGAGVDIRTLLNGGPGSLVGMATLDGVKWEKPADVTRGAYEEQDRLSVDFDDAAGVMSQSSIMSNKQLNETVGGMTMLTGTANASQEYMIRTITETWVKPVLQQLIELQSDKENDEELISQAAGAAGLDVTGGMDEAFELLQVRVIATPDVGFGSTSPDKRIGRITMALDTVAKYKPDLMQQLDPAEIAKEVFGAVGHDGERFFPGLSKTKEQDPRIAQLEQQLQELQKVIETKQVEVQGRIDVAKVNQEGALAREKLKHDAEAEFKKATMYLEERKLDIDAQLATANTDAKRGELILQREALNKAILDTEREFALQLYTLGLAPDIGPAPSQLEVAGQEGPVPVDGVANPPDMPGNDKAGTLARDDYGDVPFDAQ